MRLTDQETFDACDAIITQAIYFETLVRTRAATKQKKDVWIAHGARLRRLSDKLLGGRKLSDLNATNMASLYS